MMTTKTMIIIALILLIVVLSYLTFRVKYPLISFRMAAFKALKKYSYAVVANAEKIYRLETNHFKSGQFLHTWSPGMEQFGFNYPYGWHTLDKIFWSQYPTHKPIGFYTASENKTGIKKTFLKFANITDALLTVCAFLENNGNIPSLWFSKNLNSQINYQKSLDKIKPLITDAIYV